MPDPFLQAHQVLERFYLMSFPLSPISIRDQMVRGRMIVDRAVDQGLIGGTDGSRDRVLVVGAGAGGATAAIRTAQHNVEAWLVDKASAPFLVQARATTRWIDPTQYDWPMDQWLQAHFPWAGPAMQLPFSADRAHNLATIWTTALNRSYRHYWPHLRLENGAYPQTITPVRGALSVRFNRPHLHVTSPSGTEFQMVIWAAGFGRERCEFVSPSTQTVQYRGRAFWDKDELEKADCGLGLQKPVIVISGAGDGALQDFLRVVTKRKSAVEIFRALPIPASVDREIHSAEERGGRWFQWGDSHRVAGARAIRVIGYDNAHYAELDRVHRGLVESLLSDAAVMNGLRRLIPSSVDVCVVHPGRYLNAFYGLNRFLALLVARFLEEEQGRSSVLMNEHQITDIQAVGQFDHDVTIDSFPVSSGRPTTIRANVIVVRHGVSASGPPPLPRQFWSRTALERARHLMPCYALG